VGLRQPQQFPLGAAECVSIRWPNDFPVGDHTLQILGEEVCHLHSHCQWPDHTEPAVRRSFQAVHPCSVTGRISGAFPGFVVDHIKPLKRGGADAPSNMQSETTAAAKAKNRVE
jgi:hypothetical protein